MRKHLVCAMAVGAGLALIIVGECFGQAARDPLEQPSF